jgi:hypothetical protein
MNYAGNKMFSSIMKSGKPRRFRYSATFCNSENFLSTAYEWSKSSFDLPESANNGF